MNKYVIEDILEMRDYIDWRELIKLINKEYHSGYYLDETQVLRCAQCGATSWNWRSIPLLYSNNLIHHIIKVGSCLICHYIKTGEFEPIYCDCYPEECQCPMLSQNY